MLLWRRMLRTRRAARRGKVRVLNMEKAARIALSFFLAIALLGTAHAASMSSGVAAFKRENFNAAAAVFIPRAQLGNAAAQSYLGYMYSTGRGVPQNYVAGAYWYHRAAAQGDTTAQYMLGLMYDKGQGVAQDYIEAHKWLNLAAAHAPPRSRDYSARLRDAIATKMTRGQLGVARLLALQWVAVTERPGIVVAPLPY
jgi:TPR repeat protein